MVDRFTNHEDAIVGNEISDPSPNLECHFMVNVHLVDSVDTIAVHSAPELWGLMIDNGIHQRNKHINNAFYSNLNDTYTYISTKLTTAAVTAKYHALGGTA